MKKIHIAIGVRNIARSVKDYSKRLGKQPSVVIPHEYALWRTRTINFSIRRVGKREIGKLRHFGWEDPRASKFTQDVDGNGIKWERFNAKQQAQEIIDLWPGTRR